MYKHTHIYIYTYIIYIVLKFIVIDVFKIACVLLFLRSIIFYPANVKYVFFSCFDIQSTLREENMPDSSKKYNYDNLR